MWYLVTVWICISPMANKLYIPLHLWAIIIIIISICASLAKILEYIYTGKTWVFLSLCVFFTIHTENTSLLIPVVTKRVPSIHNRQLIIRDISPGTLQFKLILTLSAWR